MRKHEKILQSYQRNHKTEFIADSEISKLKRESARLQKLDRKVERSMRKMIDEDPFEESEYTAALLEEEKRLDGGRKTHKNRLKELSKNDLL